MGSSGSSAGKESIYNAGDPGSIPGSGRSPGEGDLLPTPVFWPGEFHGERNLTGYSPWDRKELDMSERLSLSLFLYCISFLFRAWSSETSSPLEQ